MAGCALMFLDSGVLFSVPYLRVTLQCYLASLHDVARAVSVCAIHSGVTTPSTSSAPTLPSISPFARHPAHPSPTPSRFPHCPSRVSGRHITT